MSKKTWALMGSLAATVALFGTIMVCSGQHRGPAVTRPPKAPAVKRPRGAPPSNQWQVIGPGGGGAFYSPAVSPLDHNIILAATDMTGCFLSRDGGRTWRAFYLRWRCTSFAFDAKNPDVFYAMASGLFLTEDGGENWKLVYPTNASGITYADDEADTQYTYTGKYQDSGKAIATDPTQGNKLYLAAESQIWVSEDRGAHWQVVQQYKDGKSAPTSLFVDPSSPPGNRSFVLGSGAGVRFCAPAGCRYSVPGNASWLYTVTAGTQPGGGPLTVYALTDPSLKTGPLTGGLLASKDNGATWTQVTDSLLPTVSSGSFPSFLSVATCASDSRVLYLSYTRYAPAGQGNYYLGVFRSDDGGATWETWWKENAQLPSEVVEDTWVTPVFGAEWGENPLAIGVDPTNPSFVVATDLGRILISRDGSRTWRAAYSDAIEGGGVATTGLDVTTSYGVHRDPFDPTRLFVTYTDIGLWRSEDDGQSWVPSFQGIPRNWRNTAYWMEFDPAVKGKVWMALSNVHDLPRARMKKAAFAASARGGVAVSDDGGVNWRPLQSKGLPDSPVTHLILDPSSPASGRTLYAVSFKNGVFKSTDGGEHWNAANEGLPESGRAWRMMRDAEGTLYLAIASFDNTGATTGDQIGSLWRSRDGAASWTEVALPAGVTFPSGITADPRNPSRLYLAAWPRYKLYNPKKLTEGGVFLSTDRGATWQQVFQGDGYAYDVTYDPANPDVLYVTGPTASAWRSADAGRTWSRLPGFRFKFGHRIIPDPLHPGTVFVTTFGNSVWRGPAEGVPAAKEDIAGPGPVMYAK